MEELLQPFRQRDRESPYKVREPGNLVSGGARLPPTGATPALRERSREGLDKVKQLGNLVPYGANAVLMQEVPRRCRRQR